MAESNRKKMPVEIEHTSVMTGGYHPNRYLFYQLKSSIGRAKRIDIIVSFLMESGVKMLLKDLKNALNRGVKLRILTGNYLGITQPSALYMIKQELGEQAELRFYNEKNRSFHPKSYIFHYEKESEIFIGSSNISRSALTSGIEWNYRFSSLQEPEHFQMFYETFEDLFQHHSIVIDDEELKRYSKSWHKPAVAKDMDRYDEQEESADSNVSSLFEPRGAQIEALYALNDSRAEGAVRGLVQAATGIGKTYLAAFDSKAYEKVLFVAHREEILKQAAESFYHVRQSENYGFFNQKHKDTECDVVFASVSTLGKEKYLTEEYFAPDYFDYMVIDEFHHAVTDQYRRIVEYFKPKFMLGLTATPERMDGKNIYEICDYNVPYEISLKEAINKGLLVPFHYYGIYDETDYSGIHLVRGHYEEEELNRAYIGNARRYDMIYKYYKKYPSKQALGFCCSKKHAEDMAREFVKRGVSAAAVYSNGDGEYAMERKEAIEKLKAQELNIIFCVDMFNEGLDIASLDMVLFLRPTESPIVFLQQLGRGLRTYRGKAYLNVLDFIGNYEKAGQAPLLLGGGRAFAKENPSDYQKIEYPDDCLVDFDMRLIDLFREMENKKWKLEERIAAEYMRIRELLGKVPSRMDLFTYMEDAVYERCVTTPSKNPFRNYLSYIEKMGDLDEEEKQLKETIGREFLTTLETTNMSKVYKMPVLLSFCEEGSVHMEITENQVLQAWKAFFYRGTNWKDFNPKGTFEEFKAITDAQHLAKIKKMPVHFLKQSGNGYFVDKEGYLLALREEMSVCVDNEALFKHMKDIIEYRTMEYYRRRYEGKL